MRLMIDSMFWEKKWDSIPQFFLYKEDKSWELWSFCCADGQNFWGCFSRLEVCLLRLRLSRRHGRHELISSKKFRKKWPDEIWPLLQRLCCCIAPPRLSLCYSSTLETQKLDKYMLDKGMGFKSSKIIDTSFDTSGPSYGNQWFRGLFFVKRYMRRYEQSWFPAPFLKVFSTHFGLFITQNGDLHSLISIEFGTEIHRDWARISSGPIPKIRMCNFACQEFNEERWLESFTSLTMSGCPR